MTVVCAMPGDVPPPPWLALVVGVALIGCCVYRCKTWRDEDRTVRDTLITSVLFLAGGVIVVYGVALLFHA